ncbi:MAG TPA: hypothetical protein VF231_00150, partial [Candidatus Limnocylindrales bacterium]
MTAGEFAFLAIGLVLGVGVGSAAVQVLRARAPSHQVRVTVAPNSIPSRRASTLAEAAPASEAPGPARGGPADRRNADRIPSSEDHERATSPEVGGNAGRGVGLGRFRTPVLAPSGIERVAIDATEADLVSPARIAAAIGIPISMEPDPELASLRAAAAKRETVAAGVARASRASAGPSNASTGASGTAAPAATESARDSGGPGAAGSGATADSPPPSDPNDACAEVRRVADERCAVSTRAREGAREAVEALRTAQRSYDDLGARAEEATAAADPRAVRSAKEVAQHAFRAARSAARTREAVEAAAREWLSEINRINHETREALTTVERDRAAATELAATLERLAVEADAARISAETAEEACVAAREAVATCQEAAAVSASGAKTYADVQPDDDLQPTVTPMGSRASEDAAIIRLLRGDRDVLMRIVATLGGGDEQERRRWQAGITG